MKTDIWMPIYVKDYLADTSRLSTLEHGAYFLLLMDYWTNGELPNDDKILMQITKLDENNLWVIHGLLEKHFTHNPANNTWKNKRSEEEKEKATKKKEIAILNGKKGGRPKSDNPDHNLNHNQKDNLNHNQTPPPEKSSAPAPAPAPLSSPLPSSSNNVNTGAHSFKKPTIREIQEYCQQRKNSINPEAFFNHYESVNWFRGKTKIKDWKACVRTWESNNYQKGVTNHIGKPQNKAEETIENAKRAIETINNQKVI